MTAPITYFRSRVEGPEMHLEDAVAASMSRLFCRSDWPNWIGGQLPLGAGIPDLVSVWYDPLVEILTSLTPIDEFILAFLRSVRQAKPELIGSGTGSSPAVVASRLNILEGAGLVRRQGGQAFQIAPSWRRILPDVIAVEAKIGNWKKALDQAKRNQIFAHRSYIAVPERTSRYILDTLDPELYGVGVISVSNCGEATISRLARRHTPTVWMYYFQLASVTARQIRGAQCRSSSIFTSRNRSTQSSSSSSR